METQKFLEQMADLVSKFEEASFPAVTTVGVEVYLDGHVYHWNGETFLQEDV